MAASAFKGRKPSKQTYRYVLYIKSGVTRFPSASPTIFTIHSSSDERHQNPESGHNRKIDRCLQLYSQQLLFLYYSRHLLQKHRSLSSLSLSSLPNEMKFHQAILLRVVKVSKVSPLEIFFHKLQLLQKSAAIAMSHSRKGGMAWHTPYTSWALCSSTNLIRTIEAEHHSIRPWTVCRR